MGKIEEACGRIEHLVESGYLPDNLKRDLELLLQTIDLFSSGVYLVINGFQRICHFPN